MNKVVVIARDTSVTENIARGINASGVDLRKTSLFDQRNAAHNEWKVHLDANSFAVISDNHLSTVELTEVIREATSRGVRRFLIVEHKHSEGLPEGVRIPTISSGASFDRLNRAIQEGMGISSQASNTSRRIG